MAEPRVSDPLMGEHQTDSAGNQTTPCRYPGRKAIEPRNAIVSGQFMDNHAIQQELEAFKELPARRLLDFFRLGQWALRIREGSPKPSEVTREIADNAGMHLEAVENAMKLAEWMGDESCVISLATRRNVKGEPLTVTHVACLVALTDVATREQFLKLALIRGWNPSYLWRKVKAHLRGPKIHYKPPIPRTVKGFLSSIENMASRFLECRLNADFDEQLLRPLRRVQVNDKVDDSILDRLRRAQAILDQLALWAANRSEELLAEITRLERATSPADRPSAVSDRPMPSPGLQHSRTVEG
jgi:hypothetical protein